MELTAYLHPDWVPLIRPAPAAPSRRDTTPQAPGSRGLPPNLANGAGWEVLCPCAFDAIWDGGTGIEAVTIRLAPDANSRPASVSSFGQGVIGFRLAAIFRTPPGWNLWIGGSPNLTKDAIAPLTGFVETDWSPFAFTMHWRFTRPDQWVHFDAMEPFCLLFPVQRAALEAFALSIAPLGDASVGTPFRASEQHTKLRLRPFDRSAPPDMPVAPAEDARPVKAEPPVPVSAPAEDIGALKRALAKREWLLETQERQRDLVPAMARIERRARLGADEFLERHYATGRPVIVTGEMDDWPALRLWTPAYLKAKVGAAPIEYQGARIANARFEMDKDRHRREAPFDAFIDEIGRAAGNDAYITAYNSERNRAALAKLSADMGHLPKFLTREHTAPDGMMWIGPAGTVTSLHHDLTNNFIAQIVGRKRVKILPAAEVGRIYNHKHVFSEIADLEDPTVDPARYPRLVGARAYDIVLEAGEILFMPLAWWHQVKSLSFSVTVTYTNFRWPNDGHATYPAD